MSCDANTTGAMPAIEGVTPDLLPDKDRVYYNDYSTLVQQQGMLQDFVRTSIYQFALFENAADFQGKTVLDVGAGTGILSFFAARAGAARVYAVEASAMAAKAEKLAAGNGLQGVVTVLNQKVEEVTLDERVDVLISEPLGIALVNERMLESYLHARDKLVRGLRSLAAPRSRTSPPHRERRRAACARAAQAGRQNVPRSRGDVRRAVQRRRALSGAVREGRLLGAAELLRGRSDRAPRRRTHLLLLAARRRPGA
jgi:SAM-dependent methyltransferase